MTPFLAARFAVAFAALIAALPAAALRRSHDGTGEAVLVPYYTVRDGRQTLLSVVNNDEQPKAVRFVLAEGRNGRLVLNFNIYLAPGDTWTGALIAAPVGARLLSNDHTCTAPAIPSEGVALRDYLYRGSFHDGLGTDPARLAEGQVEVIELGVLTDTAADLPYGQCNALLSRFVGGVWASAPNTDIAPPSGRLSVDAQIVDVAAGTIFDVPTVALEDFSGGARHSARNDSNDARFIRPTLAPSETRFVVEGDSYIAADRPADAVSLVLMASRLEGPFSVEPALAATTEWIVALPTRQAYLDNRPGGELAVGTAPIAPFGVGRGSEQRCNEVTWETITRHGDLVGNGDNFFPARIDATLCAQVTRVTLTRDFPSTFDSFEPLTTRGERNGRLRLGLRPDLHRLNYTSGPSGTHNGVLQGLPVLALPLIEARNGAAQPGLLATYGYTGHVVRRQTGFIDF